MDIYKYLPKLNCGKCGFQVCSAFATSLLQGTVKLGACTPLKDPKYQKNLHDLKKFLGPHLQRTLGWT
ncbi:MAG: (Fe-S)-binding protein [Promethearchaeota archaeon]